MPNLVKNIISFECEDDQFKDLIEIFKRTLISNGLDNCETINPILDIKRYISNSNWEPTKISRFKIDMQQNELRIDNIDNCDIQVYESQFDGLHLNAKESQDGGLQIDDNKENDIKIREIKNNNIYKDNSHPGDILPYNKIEFITNGEFIHIMNFDLIPSEAFVDNEKCQMVFTSLFEPPIDIIKQTSRKFPTIPIRHQWAGEIMGEDVGEIEYYMYDEALVAIPQGGSQESLELSAEILNVDLTKHGFIDRLINTKHLGD